MRTILIVGLSVFALFPYADGTVATLAEKMADITHQCCTQGLNYARNHTSQDCSSSVPPEVPVAMGSLCIFAMDGCCKEYFEKKRDCDDGIEYSLRDQCAIAKSPTAQSCCNECLHGRLDGSRRSAACSAEGVPDNADDSLAIEAYIKCCKDPRTGENQDVSSNERHHTASHKPESGPSICEDYAPNELCAHHCIPVPGSYRCECNPGFMLMPDGRNCREVQKNRCKPHNPCQHKCNDNGMEVKCSCRRGHELQADGKSCKDIDECALEPPVCLSNTKCYNIQGSYKCIPVKKNSAERGQCPPGFYRNLQNGLCDDVDECDLPSPPCPRYSCENTVGGYKCDGRSGDPDFLARNQENPAPPQEDRCPPGFRSGGSEDCEDVDECATHKDDCNPLSQFCINVRGSFYCQDKVSKHCAPGFKYSTDTNMCEDIDECVDSQSLCRVDQVCVNVPGAYDCKPKTEVSRSHQRCPEGFRVRAGKTFCEDIDECIEGTHLCDSYQTCVNMNGTHECHCKVGFELDITTGACVDINECATDESNSCIASSQRCDNTVGSYLCIRITSCGTGYILHHTTSECEDVDECAVGSHNCGHAGPNYHCVNIPGSFRCVKQTTTTTSTAHPPGDYEYYYDSDEEEQNDNKTSPAQPKDTRHEIPSSTTVTPRPETPPETETSLPPTTTVPTPEYVSPAENNPEQPEAEQDNRIDSASSDKPQSYDDPPRVERPEQYPTPTQRTDEEDRRPNRPGLEVTRVFLGNSSESPVTVKGIQSLDGSVLVDTQDVPKNIWTKIAREPDLADCRNGYERDDYGECVDVDECASGKHICSSLTESCRNTYGGYVCDCAAGFRRDAATAACDLIPTTTSTTTTTTTTTTTPSPPAVDMPAEVANQWTHWGFPLYEPPHIKPFKPRNKCDVGFHWNPKTNECEDIDECTSGLASCSAVEKCVNTRGGYRCECPPNWRLDEARHRCVPVRNNELFPPGYGNLPSDTSNDVKTIVIGHQHGNPGNKYVDPTLTSVGHKGEILKCPWGYWLGDDNRCIDIDECAMDTANCGLTQICTNLQGGYTCSCPAGHRLYGNNLCADVDECALAGNNPICSEHADCVNTVGSYRCRCHEGFRSAPANDKVCVDVDECTESRGGALCDHRCNNVWGGYRCSCHRGYRINMDNKTCSDVDECTEFASKQLCVGRCLNEPGSYRCSCPSGYRLSEDKRSCIDIDECESGEATCANRSPLHGMSEVCLNTRGGYRCHRITCPPGYNLQNKHRCTRVQSIWSCPPSDWECTHQPTTYSYNYITFVSNLYIPDTRVDLFTMRGLSHRDGKMKFQLKLVDVNAPPTVKEKADVHSFQLTPTNTEAVVSLVKSLQGPQSIELELSMEVFHMQSFQGIAVAKIFIYVSEYTF